MTDPIRVLHFADTHIGVESYGGTDPETGLSSRVRDFLRRMDDMHAYAEEHGVDLIVFAGDAFKTRSPSPTYQREFAHRISDLAELAPVILLVGNHDVPPNYLRASSIEIYDTLRVPNVHLAVDYGVEVVETARGPVAVGTAPYPTRSWMLQGVNTSGMTITEVDQTLQEVLTDKIEDLAEQVERLDMPRLLTGHFTVSGAVVGSERQIMLGRDVSVSLSTMADSRWDYVALGHIHKHQDLTKSREDAPPVVYSGSLERIDFGEEGDPKGFCWVNLARGGTWWAFVDVDARPFITLRADLRDDDDPTGAVRHKLTRYDLNGAVVRLLLQFSVESAENFDEAAIRQALKEAGAFSVAAIRKEVAQPARARLGASPEGLSNLELLERYLISTDTPEDRRQRLMEAAKDVIDSVESGDEPSSSG